MLNLAVAEVLFSGLLYELDLGVYLGPRALGLKPGVTKEEAYIDPKSSVSAVLVLVALQLLNLNSCFRSGLWFPFLRSIYASTAPGPLGFL